MDYFYQTGGSFAYCSTFVYVALFYIGMYLYINGMVEDLQKTLRESGHLKDDMWATYVEQIHLHNDIIELSRFINNISIFHRWVCPFPHILHLISFLSEFSAWPP